MIKFFRIIRKQWVTENRFRKYLLYALGEIILVVIGILIALQINNWNEYEKGYQKTKVFLTEIKEDLVSDSLFLSRAIRTMEQQIVYEEWALSENSYQVKDIDSLRAIFKNQYWDFASIVGYSCFCSSNGALSKLNRS